MRRASRNYNTEYIYWKKKNLKSILLSFYVDLEKEQIKSSDKESNEN